MSEPLRVLFVEDSSDDAELETLQLRRAGFEVTASRVCSGPDLEAAIDGPWQVIIADYNMPNFTGLDALAIWRQRRPDIPFILVSGTLGEERAVDALKSGAADYLIKDNLRRLGPAVVRALREAAAQRARERAAQAERFLVRASAVLGESLDYHATLKRVAELVVAELADWCAVDVVDDAGKLESVALVHREAGAGPPSLAGRQPRRADAPFGPEHVVRTAEAQLVTQVSDDALTPDDEQRAYLAELGVRSYLAVPLRARGAVLGALTLASARAGRGYDATDLAFAEELARRIGFAVDNARLYRRTQEAVRLRDDFLSVASHELRTPLTTLQLQLQSLLAAMLGGRPTVVNPRDESKLKRAVRSTERLSDLVDTLVDVSRIASGSLPLSRVRVDLGASARKVVERYAEESRRVESPLVIKEASHPGGAIVGHWDRERIEQMIGNLLSNALKYGVGKPIDIELTSADGWAEITVRDRGMGISPEDLERIFGRFERAVSVRNYGGLGLGLYMTREIAQSHGGSIRATSTPGEGAAFTIRLPIGHAPPG
ncbi:MAG TPA: ATP-binding protein [Polyangia bacterium]|nr:ATP-binding protein [Polyangia bacterium]